jgi:hypothetical protein
MSLRGRIVINDKMEILWKKRSVLSQNLSRGIVQRKEEPNPKMLPSIPGLLVEISYYYLLALQPGVGP